MLAAEKHYSVQELAALWAVSEKTIRRVFEDAPGVLRFSLPRILPKARTHKPHVRLSIPASVAERLHEQWSGGTLRVEVKRGRRVI